MPRPDNTEPDAPAWCEECGCLHRDGAGVCDMMRPSVAKALAELKETWDIEGEQLDHIAELMNDVYNAGANARGNK